MRLNFITVLTLNFLVVGCIKGSPGSIGLTGSPGSNGHNALVSDYSVDPSLCTQGGVVIEAGTDLNDDGTLETNEVTMTAIICNGVDAPVDPLEPVSIVEPCAQDPNDPTQSELEDSDMEMFIKLEDGTLLATVSLDQSGTDTHLGVVTPGVEYESTGIGSNCLFSVNSQGIITKY